MSRAMKVSMLTLVATSLMSATIHAQLREGDPLRFSLNIGAEYTDNRDSQASGESNTDIWAKPRLDAVADWGRGKLDFYYQPAFRYRTDPSDVQNYTELYHDISVILNHDVHPRFGLNVNERFARTDDPSIQRGGTTLRRDSSYIMNWAGLGARYKVRPRTVLSFGGGNTMKRYDESEVAIESDEDKTHGDIRLTHYAAPTLALSVMAQGKDVDYEHSSGVDRDYTSGSGGVSIEKIFGKSVRGSARAGVKSLSYDNDTIPSDDAPYFGVDMKVEPMPSRRFFVGGTYELRESYTYPHSSQEYSDIHARAELDFAARLTLKVGAAYQVGDYDLETVPPEAGANVVSNPSSYSEWVQHFILEGNTSGKDETIITTVEVVYKIDDNTSLALSQRYEDVDSDVGVSFDRNAVGLTLTRAF